MAIRSLTKVPATPYIGLQRDAEGNIPVVEIERLADTLQKVLSILSGGLSFGTGESSSLGGNVYSQFIDYVFTAANTSYSIPHGLGQTPTGFLVVVADRACHIYDGNFKAAWGPSVVTLASDTANAKVKLLLLG